MPHCLCFMYVHDFLSENIWRWCALQHIDVQVCASARRIFCCWQGKYRNSCSYLYSTSVTWPQRSPWSTHNRTHFCQVWGHARFYTILRSLFMMSVKQGSHNFLFLISKVWPDPGLSWNQPFLKQTLYTPLGLVLSFAEPLISKIATCWFIYKFNHRKVRQQQMVMGFFPVLRMVLYTNQKIR